MRNIGSKIDGEVSFLATDSDRSGSGSGKVQYLQGQGRLTWRFARFWTLSGAYRHRQLDRSSQSGSAVSNAVLVTLRYGKDKMLIRR